MNNIEPILPMQKPGLNPKRKLPTSLIYCIILLSCFLLALYLDGCDTPVPATTSTSK